MASCIHKYEAKIWIKFTSRLNTFVRKYQTLIFGNQSSFWIFEVTKFSNFTIETYRYMFTYYAAKELMVTQENEVDVMHHSGQVVKEIDLTHIAHIMMMPIHEQMMKADTKPS